MNTGSSAGKGTLAGKVFAAGVVILFVLSGVIAIHSEKLGGVGQAGERVIDDKLGCVTDIGREGGYGSHGKWTEDVRAGYKGNSENDPHYEQDEFGGSWFDDFDDESGIEEKKGVAVENGYVLSNWLAGWKYRRSINLANPGGELSAYQLQVNLTQNNFDYGSAGENGTDIRFIDSNGDSLDYWVENWDTNDKSSIWVNVSSIPNGDSAIHIYYGNGDAHSESNASNVFILYDDFDDGVWTDKWNETKSDGTSSASESDGTLKVLSKDGDDYYEQLDSKVTFEVPFVYEARYKFTSGYYGRLQASSASPQLSSIMMECTRYSSDFRKLEIWGDIGPTVNQQFSFTESWKEYRMMLRDSGGGGTAVLRAGDTLDTWEDTVAVACGGTPSDYSCWRAQLATTCHSSYGPESKSEYDWVRVRKYTPERPGHTISSREEVEDDQYIESEDITLSGNGGWDTFSVNLDEGGYGKVRLSVKDGSTGEVIPGFHNLDMRNIDISGLNELGIIMIRVRANVLDAGIDVPVIDSWGVEWTAENAWRDGFTGDGKSTSHSPIDEHTVGYWNFDDGTAEDLAGNNDGTHYGNTRLLMHFDEGEGQDVADDSDYDNNGQLGSGSAADDKDPARTSQGMNGGALSFDGEDDYVDCGSDASLDIIDEITVEAWIYPRNWGSYGDYGFGRIVTKGNFAMYLHDTASPGAPDHSLFVILKTGGQTRYLVPNTDSIKLNTWQHVAFTYNGSDFDLYIDGVQRAYSVSGGHPSGSLDSVSGSNLIIGNNEALNRPFNGTIDEVGIYSRILSHSDIQSHYTSKRAQFCDIVEGPRGQGKALRFDGIDDYIDCGNDASLNLGTDSFTVESWVNTDEVLDDTIGDIASKFDRTNKKGFNFNIMSNTGSGSPTNCRNVNFGMDSDHPDSAWVQRAPRLGNESEIYCTVVYNGKLYAGTKPNAKLFEWNGVDAWVEKASGSGIANEVDCLAVYNGKLYAGVYPTGKLLEWNGVDSWIVRADQLNGQGIRSLAVYDGKLYGGTLSGGRLFEWNGVDAWVQKADRLDTDRIYGLVAYNDKLYASVGENMGKLYEWNSVDAWVERAAQPAGESNIYSMALYHGKLYGGGNSGRLYEWNGEDAWIERASSTGRAIVSLAVYNGKLYGGVHTSGKLVEWNGVDAWIEKASNGGGHMYTLTVYDGKLYSCTSAGTLQEWKSGVSASYDHELTCGWHHLAAVKDNDAGRLKLYVDGIQVSESDSFDPQDYDLTNSESLKIGFGAQDYFNGIIDEVRISDIARTPKEIHQSYLGGVDFHGGQAEIAENWVGGSSCVGYWKLDEGSGNTISDTSESENSGTLYNMDNSNWVDGKFGKSLSFNGINEYVEIPNDDSLNVDSEFSIFAWIYRMDDRNTWERLISRSDIDDSPIFWLQITNRDTIGGGFTNENGVSQNPLDNNYNGVVVPLNQWVHIGITFNGTHTRSYYNGELDEEYPANGTPKASNKALSFGRLANAGSWYYNYKGNMDQVGLWSQALTPSEIQEQYASTPYLLNGNVRSETIQLPDNHTLDTLHFNRDVPQNTYLNISIHDGVTHDVLYEEYNATEEATIDLSTLDLSAHPAIYLSAYLQSNVTKTPFLYDWSVNWTVEEPEPIPPELIGNVPSEIFVTEDTPEVNITDLSDHFNDIYSSVQVPTYALQHVSDEVNMTLSFHGSRLNITYLAENWTGTVSVIANCTNMHGLSTPTNMFNISVTGVNDPPVAELLLPANGAILADTDVKLEWRAADADNDTDEMVFDIYFGDGADPALNATNVTGSNLTMIGLENGTTYYWYVMPCDGISEGLCLNGPWNFTVDLNATRPTLKLLSPPNGSILGNTSVNLTWSPTSRTGEPLTFRVLLGDSVENLTEVAVVSDTWYLPEGPDYNRTYYWTVIPHAGGLAGICLDGTWHFEIRKGFVPVHNVTATLDVSSLVLFKGENGSFNVTVTNNGNVLAIIDISPQGSLNEFLAFDGTHQLESGASRKIRINISNTSTASVGIHDLVIDVITPVQTLQLTLKVNITEKVISSKDDDTETEGGKGSELPWMWIGIGIVLLVVVMIGILIFIMKRRRDGNYDDEEDEGEDFAEIEHVPERGIGQETRDIVGDPSGMGGPMAEPEEEVPFAADEQPLSAQPQFQPSTPAEVPMLPDGAPHPEDAGALPGPGETAPMLPGGPGKQVPALPEATDTTSEDGILDPVPQSMENLIPGYTLLGKLGMGGFATVYKAIGKRGEVAIKLPKFIDSTIDTTVLRKFKEEGDMWKKLRHSNIVEFYEGDIRPLPYMIIEYMEGGNLLDLLKKGAIPVDVAIDNIRKILSGMAYAHRMASVHRDIKPENILFTKDGTPKISDWGIGKFMASESVSKSIGTKGTLAYSSPEQISEREFGEVDWSTDVFQLGIVFYEMLTGENPFLADDPVKIMSNMVNLKPEPPSKLRPKVPALLDHIIMRSLEKKKEMRYSSAGTMLADLNKTLEERVKNIEHYKEMLRAALADGKISSDEEVMLGGMRNRYGISDDEGEKIRQELGF